MPCSDSYKDHISSKDAEILHQRKAKLNQLRGLTSEEGPEVGGSETSSNFGRLELGSTYEWSDSSSLSDRTDSDFHDTIEAIREEAARIDTIMALDQLDTMKQELQMQKKIVEASKCMCSQQRSYHPVNQTNFLEPLHCRTPGGS